MENWKKKVSLFIISQLTSQFGTALVQYAIFWYITLNTRSGFMLTISIIVGFLPTFLLSPFAGVWSDRFSRKKLIIISDLSIAFTTLILALVFLSGYREFWLLFLISGIRAIGIAIQTPATNALLPQIVPEDKILSVNGYMGSATSLMNLFSPIAAGSLLTFAAFETTLFIDVVTAIIGVSILSFIKVPILHETGLKRASGYFDDIKAGFKYIRKKKYIRNLFLYFAIFFFFVTPAAFLTPLQVVRTYGSELYRLTALEIAFFLGMTLGGFVIGKWGGWKNLVHTMIVAILTGGILHMILGTKVNFILYLFIMFIIGVSVIFCNTATTVFLQKKVDEEYYGRVFGVMGMLSSSMFPLGMLVFGPLADKISIELILIVTGFIVIIEGLVMVKDKGFIEAGNT
ncbi:MAG: MFS transporter [Firmicutes bacterium]|nr:MFS transporter [Bacillota bacterium]